jgi:hypothetical protein
MGKSVKSPCKGGNFSLFLRQQTDKRQTSVCRMSKRGLRKITLASGFLFSFKLYIYVNIKYTCIYKYIYICVHIYMYIYTVYNYICMYMKLETVVPLYSNRSKFPVFSPVLWIRIRKDPKLVRRSGSGVTVRIRSQLQVKDGYAATNYFVIVIICQTMNKK